MTTDVNFLIPTYLRFYAQHAFESITDTQLILIISTIIAAITYAFLSRFRIIVCRWLLSQHFWINDSPKPNSKKVWWYMFWVRVFTAFFEFDCLDTKEPECYSPELLLERKRQRQLALKKDNGLVLNKNAEPNDNSLGNERSLDVKNDSSLTLRTAKIRIQSFFLNFMNRLFIDPNRKVLFSCQNLLPNLPVPYLSDTMNKLKASLDILQKFDPGALPAKYEERLNEFEKGIGQKLQFLLLLRSMMFTDNYVSDWWEKYVYTMNRKSLAINSNYYILDMSYYIPTQNQCARAAVIVYYMLKFRQEILNQTLKPLKVREIVPVCMDQYKRLFSTCRIPGHDFDILKHFPPHQSKHIIIYVNGNYYKLNVDRRVHVKTFDSNVLQQPYEAPPTYILQMTIEKIVEKSCQADPSTDTENYKLERALNTLTALERNEWAEIRGKYFSVGLNKKSLDTIESAILMVTIDTTLPQPLSEPLSFTDQARQLLSGFDIHNYDNDKFDGISRSKDNGKKLEIDKSATFKNTNNNANVILKNPAKNSDLYGKKKCPLTPSSHVWLDKSVNLLVFPSGKIGLNCEHSYADATITGHLHEYTLSNEVKNDSYDSDGNCQGYLKASPTASPYVFAASKYKNLDVKNTNVKEAYNDNEHNYDNNLLLSYEKLDWDWSNKGIKSSVTSAHNFALQNAKGLDICVEEFVNFGKGFMKQKKISPDAFIQIAIQLAYYDLSISVIETQMGNGKILSDTNSTLFIDRNNLELSSSKYSDINNFGSNSTPPSEFIELRMGRLRSTYEASSTRLFVRGRTETVRTLTNEIGQFITSMYDPNSTKAERIIFFKTAANKHQSLYKEAMTGKGIDRHLFALFVMSKMMGKDCQILKEILSIPWDLSTSQSPQQQITNKIDFDSPVIADKLSPGGGFGPVTPNGFGIAYMIPCSYKLFFHVTRFKKNLNKSSNNISEKGSNPVLQNQQNYLSSREFLQAIFGALNKLKELLND
ncbi:unnamed protein product [Gordionus sp. m RMFG-2023]